MIPAQAATQNVGRAATSRANPPPSADHSAIDFVRAGPDQSAVISASVVGYAMPAASPPTTRAPNNTPDDGAKPATSEAGTHRLIPRTIISLRPYRSPSAPNQRTDAASPSE